MPRTISIPGAQLSSIRLADGARFEPLTENSGRVVYQQKGGGVTVSCTCFGTGGCTIEVSGVPPTVSCAQGTCNDVCGIRVEVPTAFEIIAARVQSMLRRG
jgi:hypothetical protein